MVEDFGMASGRSDTGYFGGLLISAMMAGRTVTSLIWGRITDTWGRKPVLLLGIFCTMVLSLAFGFSVNYGMAIALRFAIGLLAPIGLVTKTCASEVVPDSYQRRATSFYAMSWQTGSMIGAIVGGVLVDPKSTGLIKSGFLADWPYLLPNLVTVGVCFIAMVGIAIFMEETLTPQRKETLLMRASFVGPQADLTFMDMVRDKSVFLVAMLYALNYFIYNCYGEAFPLWCWAAPKNGGLGFSPSEIGWANAAYTCVIVLIQQYVFKLLVTRKGIKWCSVFPSIMLAPICFAVPWISYSSSKIGIWVYIIGMSFLFTFLNVTVLTSQFIMSNNSVFKSQRGRANGLSQFLGSLSSALAPLIVGALFASTAQSGLPFPLNYTFCFNMMTVLCVVMWYFSRKLPTSLERTKEAVVKDNIKIDARRTGINPKSSAAYLELKANLKYRTSIMTEVGYLYMDEEGSDSDSDDDDVTASRAEVGS